MKKHLSTVIILAIGLSLSAQKLYVQPITGDQVAFVLANDLKVTFANRSMSVADGQSQQSTQFQLSEIRNFSFVERQADSLPSSISMTVADNGIRLYPNPVESELTLEIQNPTPNTTYRIFNIGGTLIKTGQAPSLQNTINMADFNNGIYIITIERNGMAVQAFRIVKQ
jgi:hypothetical protein